MDSSGGPKLSSVLVLTSTKTMEQVDFAGLAGEIASELSKAFFL